ncbi:Gfo/Idh/MocA family oxidoreductase [Arcobacter arenosus]|uniref:Gfo/Idh/MocA family oxidoreductase n=1 Tax=Arcobacter arenosus TaxID=2576037 RepID=UPI003BAACF58
MDEVFVKKFALIGVAGYIAPRHLKAIKDTNNYLDVALDKHDSVGILDSFFPNCAFFTEFERFDRYVDKFRNTKDKIDYISICSPNYLHDSHIRFALRSNAHAICEKPLVLNPNNVYKLMDIEKEYNKDVNTILQLRLHPTIQDLKKKVQAKLKENPSKIFDIDLTYITSRGKWYFYSWKNDLIKSGGVSTNIGIHFFDMLIDIFGEVQNSKVHIKKEDVHSGFLELKYARVRWFLSINESFLPTNIKQKGQRTYRNICIDSKQLEFSDGFTDLHTKSYEMILDNQGFSLEDSLSSICVASDIRNCSLSRIEGDYHPLCMRFNDV